MGVETSGGRHLARCRLGGPTPGDSAPGDASGAARSGAPAGSASDASLSKDILTVTGQGQPRRIAVVGVGRIGAVTAVGLAHLDHEVIGIDTSAERTAELRDGTLREAEPGLRAALRAALRIRSLTFVVAPAQREVDLAFLCVDTPPLGSGEPDLRQLFSAAADTAALLREGGVLVTRSTIPVGTGDRLAAVMARLGRPDVRVVHVPEFLREGRAWEDFREPDRIVIGGDDPDAVEEVRRALAGLPGSVFLTSRPTAELAKYLANAYLATSISFANEMADLSHTLGVDPTVAFEILRADRRIGPHAYLTPGLGFGGHCLPKDSAALEKMAAAYGHDLRQLHATRQVNQGRTYAAIAWLRAHLRWLDGRHICIAGLSYKAGTDDTRASPSVLLAESLLAEGAGVSAWDPLVRQLPNGIEPRPSLADAADGADAIVIAHAWEGWRALDPAELRRRVRSPLVYDAPCVLDIDRWVEAGFTLNRDAPGRESIRELPVRVVQP